VSTPRPFRLELPGGEFLVGDELTGTAPAYVFLHGLGSVRCGDKSTSLLAHAATSGRAFVRYDQRGHGESSGRIGVTSISELIDDAIRVFERAGRVTVVGSSLGGLVGAFAAAARPDLVRGLALIAPALGLVSSLRTRLDAHGRIWTSDGRGHAVQPDVLADAEALDESTLAGRLRVPTLVVHGTEDEVIPPRVSERFFAAIACPRKALWIVPGGDHRLNTFAAEIWRRLDTLLAN
jgi:pimeloyl-ACP methyl ester carboxylesterase